MQPRTAFITGASSGIGAELAKRLAARGVEVGLAARREEALRDLASEIASLGGKSRTYPLDVTKPEQVIETIRRADDEANGLDLVIAGAGIGIGRWSGKLEWEHCGPIIDTNVLGAVATLTAVLPRMVERKRGHLVGISSVASMGGFPRMAVYCGSKAFLSNFLTSLRVDLRSTGVAVTDIRPGWVKTPMLDDFDSPPALAISVESCCDRILRAIDRRKAVAAFPLPLVAGIRATTALPAALYDRVIKLIMGG